MQKLHLVGVTTDHRGLIFSVRRGAKSGGYVIHLDDRVVAAVEELRALIEEEAAAEASAAAGPMRPESALSVREVQARLRRGRTVEQVAREAGVDPSWIARFAVPVIAEQAEVVRAARGTRMLKQRVGLSSATLGDSVYRNLAERGVTDPRDELDRGWSARQLTEGMWLVTFEYLSRGRELQATWEYDETTATVRARGRLATQLGFRETRRAAPKPAEPAKKTTKKASAAKRKAAPPTTARRSPSRQATRQASRRVSAVRRAATARMVTEAEKATRRNAAAARRMAKNPVVVPPRRVEALSALEPELDIEDDRADEPTADLASGANDLDARIDERDDEFDDAGEEFTDDGEESTVDDEESYEGEDDLDLEPEPEADHDDDEPMVRSARRREPLRASSRLDDGDTSGAEAARRRVRVRSAMSEREQLQAALAGEADAGNGPVFRSDLAVQASAPPDRPGFPRAAVGQSPQPPLSLPLEPIERPPRRRRRPLRGR